MPQQDQAFFTTLHESSLYSSLNGLEVAAPPRCTTNVLDTTSRYVDKPLPSLPFDLLSLPKVQVRDVISTPDSSTRRPKQSTWRSKGVGSKPRMMSHVIDRGIKSMDRNTLSGSKFIRFTESDEGLASRIQLHMNDVKRSDSTFSVSSSSVYSEEGDVEDIVDSYSRRSNWSSIEKPCVSAAKCDLYLQSSRNSESASELGCLCRPAELNLPFRPINHGPLSTKAVTLENVIEGERERSEAITLQNDLMQSEHEDTPVTKNNGILAEADSVELPSWDDYDEIIRSLALPQLGLWPKKGDEPARCMSRFSDHSSEAEANTGIISTTRDSIISHIRSIPKSFSSLSRPSVVFMETATISSIKVPSFGNVTHKRRFSLGKHPLKSPFPLSPLRKKTRLDDCRTPKGPNLVSRLSDAFTHRFSGSQKSPIILSKVISNYARDADGPDTPMPTKSETIGAMSPTSVFHKGSLQLRDAIEKAKRAAKIGSTKEKRRDQLRGQIVVVGAAKPAPGVQWL